MTKGTVRKTVHCALFAASLAVFCSGCLNQRFHSTNGSSLSAEKMQHLVLRPKYSQNIANIIPPQAKDSFESAFLSTATQNVKISGRTPDNTTDLSFYYLDAEVTKYKPGSPFGRFLMTPIIAFGLWGSYVNVDFAIYDASNNTQLGSGVIRKANQWGGIVGGSITTETQLPVCPKEIVMDLDSFMQKN